MLHSQAPALRLRAIILHTILTGGVCAMTALMLLLRVREVPSLGATQIFVLQASALAFGASGFGAAMVIRSRIQPMSDGENEDAWWQNHFSRALLVWALIEGPALVGAVFVIVTGSLLSLVVTGAGLVLLSVNAPMRLVRG